MTVEWIDAPGEWYDSVTGVYDEISPSAPTLTTVDGRRCMQIGNSGVQWVRRFMTGNTDCVVHAEVMFAGGAWAATGQIFRLLDGAAHHVDLRRQSDGKLIVTRNGTQIGSTGTTVTLNDTWYWISFKAFINDTTGSFEVKLNGATEISATNVDTRNASTGTVTKVQLGSEISPGTSRLFYIRDVIILSGAVSALPQHRVAYLNPNGAGNSTQWTPSAGSNYQNVDERDGAPDDATTYNSETTNGEIDLYALSSLPSSAGSVLAVQEIARMAKDDATSQTARMVLRTHSTNYEGSDLALSTTWQWFKGTPRATNPNTGSDWTESEIDALEQGVKKQA